LQGDHEEERGFDVFWGDLEERSAWLAGIFCDVRDTHHTPVYAIGMAKDLYQVL
jgi:hypothetical protein